MIKKRNILLEIFSIILLSFCLIFSFSSSTYAAERQKTFLQVSPSTQQLGALEPGETREGSFKVQNIGSGAFDFKVYASAYEVKSENYDPVFDGTKDRLKIASWFTFSQDIGHLEPDTEVTITYTVKVPKDAPGGGQYGAIMVETLKDKNANVNIQAISRVGLIVYSHVDGEINHCTKILENKLPGFLFNPPIFGESRVENCGNVDSELKTTLKVFPFFSNEEVYSTEEKPTTVNTLPGTKRYHKELWSNSPAIGIYRVEQTVHYGSENKTESKLVVVCPIWLIVLIVLFILSVVFWLVARRSERKASSNRL